MALTFNNSILKVRDNDGNVIDIPAIKGKDGKTAYDYAKEGGYTGTETEFIAKMASEDYIIGLSIDGQTITYIKGDGSTHTIVTQDTDTTYSLGTDTNTGLTKLYATTGSAEDGTMTQKAIKTELDKKVTVSIDTTNNTLVFNI